MRTDYILYIVAVICFIIAGWVGAAFAVSMANTATVIVLAIIGIIFIWGGYSLRPSAREVTHAGPTTPPKPAMEKEQPAMAASPTPSEPKSTPTPVPTPEPTLMAMPEPEQAAETPQQETPPSETKPVRKRRERKKT